MNKIARESGKTTPRFGPAVTRQNWLGWLDIVERERKNIEIFNAFGEDVRSAGFKDVLLMGMGGSSICPEVLGMTFGKDHFHILDSTVPARIRAIEEKLDHCEHAVHRRKQMRLDA